MHYRYYQEVLADEALMETFNERQIGYMRAYTEDFMEEKKTDIMNRMKDWHQDCFERFIHAIQ